MIQDSFWGFKDLDQGILLFRVTGLPGLELRWLLHQRGSGAPASRNSVPRSTELLGVCQANMKGPSEDFNYFWLITRQSLTIPNAFQFPSL